MKASKKLAIVAGTTAVAMAGAGVGFAYFSGGNGTGGGTASTDTASKALSVTAQLHSGNIPLDGTAVPIDLVVTNSNPYSLHWASTTVSAVPTVSSSCDAASFVVTAPASPVAGTVGPKVGSTNGTTTVDSGYTIKFVNEASTAQDSCLSGVTFTSAVNAS